MQMRLMDDGRNQQAEALYAAYPRRKNKEKAIPAILRALEAETFEFLLDAVQRYSQSTVGKPQYFIPYPATWFNQRRWEQLPGGSAMRPETVLEIARSQFAAADEAWRIVRQAAFSMELDYTGQGGSSVKRCSGNQALADAVPEPARSVAMSMRWTQIRFGDEAAVRKEFCILYERRLRAEVNRRVAPALLGAVGLPGVEQRRIEG